MDNVSNSGLYSFITVCVYYYGSGYEEYVKLHHNYDSATSMPECITYLHGGMYPCMEVSNHLSSSLSSLSLHGGLSACMQVFLHGGL